MKAWIARNVYDEEGATIVFAETSGKAKAIAMHSDTCDNCAFTDVRVSRLPSADKKYKKGKFKMDFSDPKDRYIMVKDFGFYCLEKSDDCEECKAKKYCAQFE